jgi:hypothetical protein
MYKPCCYVSFFRTIRPISKEPSARTAAKHAHKRCYVRAGTSCDPSVTHTATSAVLQLRVCHRSTLMHTVESVRSAAQVSHAHAKQALAASVPLVRTAKRKTVNVGLKCQL